MTIDKSELLFSERAVFELRSLYLRAGYRRYKVSKFEEYDLYAGNKSFLTDGRVLTFTDTDGRLMALKPDITLSIIKNTARDEKLRRVFYNECVYRADEGGFRELTQTGLECIGALDDYSVCEVAYLAYKSLEILSKDFILDLNHMGFAAALLEEVTRDPKLQKRLLLSINAKSGDAVSAICKDAGLEGGALTSLCSLYGKPDDVIPKARALVKNRAQEDALSSLLLVINALKGCGMSENLRVDLSMINDAEYYSALVFRGFIKGISQTVLSGGRYDSLLAKMGREQGAIGFAVYLDGLDRLFHTESRAEPARLTYTAKDAPEKVLYDMNGLMARGAVTVERQKDD